MSVNLSHVRYEFTNSKKLVKTLARIEASSICRQQFANMFVDCFCAVHAHTNLSLPTLVCRVKAALDSFLITCPQIAADDWTSAQLDITSFESHSFTQCSHLSNNLKLSQIDIPEDLGITVV